MKRKAFTILLSGLLVVLLTCPVNALSVTVRPDTPFNDVIQVDVGGSLVMDFDFEGFGSEMIDVNIGAYGLGSADGRLQSDIDLPGPVASFFDEFDIFGRVVLDGAPFIPIGATDFRTIIPLSTEYSYQLMIQHTGRVFDTAATLQLGQPYAAVNLDVSGQSAPVPEPATMLMLGTGLIGIAGLRKKFKK